MAVMLLLVRWWFYCLDTDLLLVKKNSFRHFRSLIGSANACKIWLENFEKVLVDYLVNQLVRNVLIDLYLKGFFAPMALELIAFDILVHHFFFALTPLNLKIIAFYLKLKTSVRNLTEFDLLQAYDSLLRVLQSFYNHLLPKCTK